MAPRPLCALYDVFTDHGDRNSVHGKLVIRKGSFAEATFAEAGKKQMDFRVRRSSWISKRRSKKQLKT